MKEKATVLVPIIIGFSLILSPILGMAAQRAITADSLEKAYAVRVAAIDVEIASTTKAIDSLPVEQWAKRNELRKSIGKLTEDKHTTEVAFKLLEEALK